jgi:hypothetical protein
MKGFNLKRLIPSLAVPTMIAAAAFAPLPGFLPAAHAATTPFLQIVNPARLELATTGGLTNGIGITFNYSCTPTAGVTPGLSVNATQSLAQSGSNQGDNVSTGSLATDTPGPIPVTCDGSTRQVATTLYGAGTFNLGTVNVTGTIVDTATGTTIGTLSATAIIRILA